MYDILRCIIYIYNGMSFAIPEVLDDIIFIDKERDIMKTKNRKTVTALFAGALLLMIIVLIVSIIKTNAYNSRNHSVSFSGAELF